MRWVKFFLSFLIMLVLIWVLGRPIGPATFATGRFFNPFEGFWCNAAESPAPSGQLPGLKEPVEVVFDERNVPHIFARNEEDLTYMQGYLTARDRLWQMEFQVFAAGGRLTELVGRGPNDAVLNLDRQARRQGMIMGARNSREQVMQNPETRSVIQAYTRGINAFINQLDFAHLPLEYKLLNYQPEPWTELKTALLLKYMANNLSARADDIAYTNALSLWGKEVFDLLYPERPYSESPIIPEKVPPRFGRRSLNLWEFEPEPPPPPPANYHPDSLLLPSDLLNQPDRNIGSNNWAVSGKKSVTGKPLLASDPHLGLNLPSIWYEIQLNAPGVNVYGASLPGAPGVIIGFNDSIAWGVTNAGRDVMDFYRITFKDDKREEYLFEGRWMKTSQEIDTFYIKGGEVFYDTVIHTHIGPVMYDRNFGNMPVPLAVKWMAQQPSNEALTFLKLNRARNYEDYVEALTHYQCPAQNFVFASAAGDIAIWQQGKFVNKWMQQGRFVLDGARSDHLWNSYIPQAHNPHILNPERGFVSSANQHPADPTYPYYYNGSFEGYRNRRLNELLSRDSLSLEDMKAFQQDNYGLMAADVLPLLLSELDTNLQGVELQARRELEGWNYMYDADLIAPTIYQCWWDSLYASIWEDEFKAAGLPLRRPKLSTTIGLLRDSAQFRFYDNIHTPGQVEDRKTLINQSFRQAIAHLSQEMGEPQNWLWYVYKNTQVVHLARLRPFSRYQIRIGGYQHILNATSRRHGPSWRMVVALGDKPEAYGVYPGGQTGNPGSKAYDGFIDNWASGDYFKLLFMRSPEDAIGQDVKKQLFSPNNK
ncbi:MAG: penicillin acylase family protein [Bacteroidetes bacterium]|nr:MAG: penicillin acylase family protein [Bacteroidota bacterium]